MSPNDVLDPQTDPQAETGVPLPNPMVTIPLSAEDLVLWRGELDRAKERLTAISADWDRNMKRYAPDPQNANWGDEINPGVDFARVEQKKAQLFYDTPTVILKPEPKAAGNPQLAQAISAAQEALNDTLGPKGIDAKRLMDKVLFDVLCPSGMGCTKIGRTSVTKKDPLTGLDVPIYEEEFWERFSTKKARIPTGFHDTEFDKAPWLGEAFVMPFRVGKRTYQLPDDFQPTKKADDDRLKSYETTSGEPTEDQISGTEIWYKAAVYDDNEVHPQKIRQLVLIDGVDEPVVHRDSPYQQFDAQGKLTPDSMIGFPIHICTIRDLADSAYVPSDCTMRRALVNELSTFRQQLINNRDASTPVRLANEKVINRETMAKLVRAPFGAILPIPETDWHPNEPPVMMVAPPQYQRENFTAQDKIEQDLDKLDAMGANQSGTEQDSVRSATELTYVQRNSDVRREAERNRVLAFFLAGVQKLDALKQMFPPAGTPKSAAVGRYSCDIKPDSGLHVDVAADRKFAMDTYNFLAKDPHVNRTELLTQLLPLLHLDPTKLIVQPPPPGPEPPKISFIVKGDDLNPLSPQYDNMIQALKLAGVTLQPTPITPELTQNAALARPMKPPKVPEHPGTAPTADLVNKHQASETGQTPNFGGMAAR